MIASRRSLVPFLLSVAALGAVGLGCAAEKRSGPGEPCTTTINCQESLTCFEGECLAEGACPKRAPIDCGDQGCCPTDFPACCSDGNCYATQADCRAATCVSSGRTCRLSSECCMGLTCQAGACKPPMPPTCAGRTCVDSAGCCTGFTCSRFGKTCQAAQNLGIGEPCTADRQCASGRCLGYCTKGCVSRADCGSVTNCLDTSEGFACLPFCQSSADCRVFGVGLSCQLGKSPDGLMLNGCFGT